MQEVLITQGYMSSPTYIIGKLSAKEGAILYLHGAGTSRERQLELCELLNKSTGKAVVIPEYSGHGKNDKVTFDDTTPAMHVSEVVMVYDWLADKIGGSEITIYAGSYAGFLAAKLMHYRKPKSVILHAPSIIFDEEIYTLRKTILSQREKTNSANADSIKDCIIETAKGYSGKLIVMKSENDELVSSHVVDAWVAAFPEATYVTVPGAIHSMRSSNEDAKKYWLEQITDFVNKQ